MTTYALHGMLGCRKDWDHLDLGVQAVDLWQAFREGDSPDLENWAQTFNSKVKSEGEKMLIGYSMGGRLAMHAMLDQPNIWCGVVVISAHPGLQSEEERKSRWENDLQWASHAREMSWSDFLKMWNQQATLQKGVGSQFQLGLEYDRESVACAFECWSLGQQQDLGPALEQCQTPVLWITGERDKKFTCLAAEVVAANDGFEHSIIPDAGHRLLFESEASLKRLKMLIGDFQKRIL